MLSLCLRLIREYIGHLQIEMFLINSSLTEISAYQVFGFTRHSSQVWPIPLKHALDHHCSGVGINVLLVDEGENRGRQSIFGKESPFGRVSATLFCIGIVQPIRPATSLLRWSLAQPTIAYTS